MKIKSSLLVFLLSSLFVVSVSAQNTSVNPIKEPVGLMCDLISASDFNSFNGYLTNFPKEINKDIQSALIFNKQPAFSWEFNTVGKNQRQVSYQLLVSDNLKQLNQDIGNIWDSGKMISASATGILFKGAVLKPHTKYYWKVKVWNNHNQTSPFSTPASFVTADELADYKNPSYPLRITEQQPISLKKVDDVYQIDFGKDAFSQLKLQLFSKTGKDTVWIRLGEVLDANGSVDRKPPGKVRYAQYALVLQKGIHAYKLNIHKDAYNTRSVAIKMPDYIGEVLPFRYVEIEGYAQPLTANALTRLFVHYKFDDESSSFHSSDSTLNAVWDLCKYSIKATSFLGIYVDGDRERIPYEADAYINQLSHYAVDKEFTMARNSHEYLITKPTWPTEWNLQSVLMAWNDYLYTGNIRSVAHYYKDLQAKTLIELADSTGLISTLTGKVTADFKASIHLKSDNLRDIVDWPRNTETDGFVFTKYNAVVNAFHYKTLVIMGQIAFDLGKSADVEMYKKAAEGVKRAYQKMFFDSKRGIFVDGIGTDHASLHANAFALALGLVDSRYKSTVMAHVKSRGMACSVYGSQFLLDGIYDAGDGEYGLSLLTSKTDRSWFNMIREGSTITMEAWDNKFKPNQDWNHAWGAAPANIISRKLMGIEPTSPGWASFVVKPQIGGLKYAEITVPTIKGSIKAAYIQNENMFEANVFIPGNTTAQIHLPLKSGKKCEVLLNGNIFRTRKVHGSAVIDGISSGNHTLKIIYKQ